MYIVNKIPGMVCHIITRFDITTTLVHRPEFVMRMGSSSTGREWSVAWGGGGGGGKGVSSSSLFSTHLDFNLHCFCAVVCGNCTSAAEL